MIGFAVSTWLEMRGCVPQGAMLLFLIMISYVHSVDTTINYIDDSTLCVWLKDAQNNSKVVLTNTVNGLMQWQEHKANDDKVSYNKLLHSTIG